MSRAEPEQARQKLRHSFDADAESYQRTRPVLPEVVLDDLCEAADLIPGSRVLEIGCGTGQATLPLARRGLSITALELGPQLADLARDRLAEFPSVRVVNASFERWDGDGPMDAVVAANSLHWIDPDVRFAKPARLLRQGGVLAVIRIRWAAPDGSDPFLDAVQEDYRAVDYPGDPPPPADQIQHWHFPQEAGGWFSEILATRYRFTATLSAADYLANLSTQSTTHELSPERAEDFIGRVADRLAAMGAHEVTRPHVALLTIGRVVVS